MTCSGMSPTIVAIVYFLNEIDETAKAPFCTPKGIGAHRSRATIMKPCLSTARMNALNCGFASSIRRIRSRAKRRVSANDTQPPTTAPTSEVSEPIQSPYMKPDARVRGV
eukprot:Amastigsp_a340486_119.p3 type:complete len:110 gc:universal Amastigsp_a340486_119:658-987(+)